MTHDLSQYGRHLLQVDRPQPMMDKTIQRVLGDVLNEPPKDPKNLHNSFCHSFLPWLLQPGHLQLDGLNGFKETNAIIGCTHFIDDLYMTYGPRIRTLKDDYKYHERLNLSPRLTHWSDLTHPDVLILSFPFPSLGIPHPDTKEILDHCHLKGVEVHIDGAWLTAAKDISFDFSHPAIKSIAFSLSKGLGLGGHRIGIRISKNIQPGSVTLLNQYGMICESLLHIGLHFIKSLDSNYFWKKYEGFYDKVCRDFNLEPTSVIHLALDNGEPRGVRPLLRILANQ